MKRHDADVCFCDDEFTGRCPCPCAECQANYVDPVQAAKEQNGAALLVVIMGEWDDATYREWQKWIAVHGVEASEYFPWFVMQRQIAFAEDYFTRMTAEQKAKYDAEWEILQEFDATVAEANDMRRHKQKHAALRYLARMSRLRKRDGRRVQVEGSDRRVR